MIRSRITSRTHPPSALSSEAADFRSAHACIILLRCHPEEEESFAARTTPDEGSMHLAFNRMLSF